MKRKEEIAIIVNQLIQHGIEPKEEIIAAIADGLMEIRKTKFAQRKRIVTHETT